MKTSSILGILVGTLALGGGVAYASSRERKPLSLQLRLNRPRYFEYGVKPGDTLSEIALRFFGDAAKRTAILDDVGKALSAEASLVAGTVVRVPCTWYEVKANDTLAKVARDALGDPKRWRRIWEANRATVADPNKLDVGVTLAVPDAAVTQPSTESTSTSEKVVAVGDHPFDLVGAHVLGGGGGHGGSHHGGHGHGGFGRRGRGGYGGGPLYYGDLWGPSEEYAVDFADAPDADDIADAVAERLAKKMKKAA